MSTENIGLDEVTETSENTQATSKTYTQEEFDRHMAGLKRKFEKKFEGVDINEYRELKTQAERVQTEQAMKRGEFEKILQESIAKKDAEIQKRDSIIKEYRVNSPLLSAAAKHRAVAPEQVKQLLSGFVRLNEDGEVEVTDEKGSVRYNDKGSLVTVEDLVQEFLNKNPHFAQATPSTTNTKTSIASSGNPNKVDLSSLDLTRADHREIYKQAKLKGQI